MLAAEAHSCMLKILFIRVYWHEYDSAVQDDTDRLWWASQREVTMMTDMVTGR